MLLLAQAEAPDAGVGGLLAGGACMIVAMLLGLVTLVFVIWALVDAIKNPALDSNMRLIWVLVIIFTGILGAILYLLIGRTKSS
jgi:hypothetical protein